MKEIISNLISTGYSIKNKKEYIVLNYDEFANSYVYLKNKLLILIYRGFKYTNGSSMPPFLRAYLLHYNTSSINLNDTTRIETPIKTVIGSYDLDDYYEPEKITKQQALKECHKFVNAIREIFNSTIE